MPKRLLFSSTDKKNCVWNFLLEILRFQNCVGKFREVTDMRWTRKFRIDVMLMNLFFMTNLCWLFTKSYFLSSDNLEKLPTDFAMIFIKTFQIRSYVSNNFSWLIFLNKIKGCKDVEYFWNKVFYVNFFLVHHKILDHFLNGAFIGSLFLVNEFIEDVRQKLTA